MLYINGISKKKKKKGERERKTEGQEEEREGGSMVGVGEAKSLKSNQ